MLNHREAYDTAIDINGLRAVIIAAALDGQFEVNMVLGENSYVAAIKEYMDSRGFKTKIWRDSLLNVYQITVNWEFSA